MIVFFAFNFTDFYFGKECGTCQCNNGMYFIMCFIDNKNMILLQEFRN